MSHTQATGAHGDAARLRDTHGGTGRATEAPRYGSRCNASRRPSESALDEICAKLFLYKPCHTKPEPRPPPGC